MGYIKRMAFVCCDISFKFRNSKIYEADVARLQEFYSRYLRKLPHDIENHSLIDVLFRDLNFNCLQDLSQI